MRSLHSAFFLVLLLAISGCSRHLRSELEQLAASPSRLVLYSLEPAPKEGVSIPSRFHGFAVLGSAEVSDAAERQTLLRELARHASNPGKALSACFNPRHGIHVERADRSVDLVICFECSWIAPEGLNNNKGFFISEAPQRVFDDALKRHRLPKSAN